MNYEGKERRKVSRDSIDDATPEDWNRAYLKSKNTDPKHYTTNAVEPIDFIVPNNFEFWRGNIVKYASRAGKKSYPQKDLIESEIADLQKCIRYCEFRIAQLRGVKPSDYKRSTD